MGMRDTDDGFGDNKRAHGRKLEKAREREREKERERTGEREQDTEERERRKVVCVWSSTIKKIKTTRQGGRQK